MIADVPLGVFLSGGVDSTLIAIAAAEASSERPKTFTVGYDVGSGQRDGRGAAHGRLAGQRAPRVDPHPSRNRRARARAARAYGPAARGPGAGLASRHRRVRPPRRVRSPLAVRAPTSCSAAIHATAGWSAPGEPSPRSSPLPPDVSHSCCTVARRYRPRPAEWRGVWRPRRC